MVSKKHLQTFARTIKESEAFDEVMQRVQQGLFKRFVNAKSVEDVETIWYVVIAQNEFIIELNRIIETIDDDKPVNDEEK